LQSVRSLICGAYDRLREVRRNTFFVQEDIMNNLNSILIEGNLVREPLYKTTPKGVPLCTFSLASNRYYRQDSSLEKEVSFFEVETWNKLAENCYNMGHKGRGVRVVGRLKQDRWVSSDGKNHSRITIVAEHVEFKPEFKRDNGYAEKIETLAESAVAEPVPAEVYETVIF
jgi:single-strand DNA-binding protein